MFDMEYMSSPMRARQYVQETFGTGNGGARPVETVSRFFGTEPEYLSWRHRMLGVSGLKILSKVKSLSKRGVMVDVTYCVSM